MQRDKALIPLSHQHHSALALCVRIERSLSPQHVSPQHLPAGQKPRWAPGDPAEWQQEVDRMFRLEIRFHFQAEEQVLFPAARQVAALVPLVEELLQEHATLEQFAARAAARTLPRDGLLEFTTLLSAHIRKEERQLFQGMQDALTSETMQALGEKLEAWFGSSGMPGAACEVRP